MRWMFSVHPRSPTSAPLPSPHIGRQIPPARLPIRSWETCAIRAHPQGVARMHRWRAIAAALAIAFAACGEPAESGLPGASVLGLEPLTNADWLSVHSDPELIQGRRVDLRARVYVGPEEHPAGDLFLAWVDFDNDQLSIAFVVPAAPAELAPGAFVEAFGVVDGVLTRRDSSGDEIVHPLVQVQRVLVTDRVGIRPTRTLVRVGQTLEQRGVRVTLDRLEFADEETRLFVTVENQREEIVSAFPTGLSVEQRELDYPAIISVGPGVEPPRGRVEPGTTEHGAFRFPPFDLDDGPMIVRWRGARVDAIADQFSEWVWVVDPSGAERPEG